MEAEGYILCLLVEPCNRFIYPGSGDGCGEIRFSFVNQLPFPLSCVWRKGVEGEGGNWGGGGSRLLLS